MSNHTYRRSITVDFLDLLFESGICECDMPGVILTILYIEYQLFIFNAIKLACYTFPWHWSSYECGVVWTKRSRWGAKIDIRGHSHRHANRQCSRTRLRWIRVIFQCRKFILKVKGQSWRSICCGVIGMVQLASFLQSLGDYVECQLWNMNFNTNITLIPPIIACPSLTPFTSSSSSILIRLFPYARHPNVDVAAHVSRSSPSLTSPRLLTF